MVLDPSVARNLLDHKEAMAMVIVMAMMMIMKVIKAMMVMMFMVVYGCGPSVARNPLDLDDNHDDDGNGD